jgi:hypothetical protein
MGKKVQAYAKPPHKPAQYRDKTMKAKEVFYFFCGSPVVGSR